MSLKRLGNVFFAVEDLDAAATFYGDVLGLPVKFRDGDRWMAFDASGTTLALAGPPTYPSPPPAPWSASRSPTSTSGSPRRGPAGSTPVPCSRIPTSAASSSGIRRETFSRSTRR